MEKGREGERDTGITSGKGVTRHLARGYLRTYNLDRWRGARESSPPPHKPLPLLDSLRLQQQISRIASDLEVVSMIADIGQQQLSCTFFRLSDRTLVGKVRDYCDLTEISGIPGGSQTFGCRMELGHFLAWRAGTNSRYSTGESPPIKPLWQELPPHLETTCKIHHINEEENVLISGTREKSAVGDSTEPKQ
jgi:hypothetical protein